MSEWKFRAASPEDAKDFAQWAIENPLTDRRDIQASTSKKNPTVLTFAIENDEGKAILFAPLYLSYTLGYLGFNPDSTAAERKRALQMILDGVVAFIAQFGIREITTLTKRGYPVAEWALKHGFEADDRETFKFDINHLLEKV